MPYQRKRPDKLSGHLRIWPDKTYIWPDIVRWPAVIYSPVNPVLNPSRHPIAKMLSRTMGVLELNSRETITWRLLTNQILENLAFKNCNCYYSVATRPLNWRQTTRPLKSTWPLHPWLDFNPSFLRADSQRCALKGVYFIRKPQSDCFYIQWM